MEDLINWLNENIGKEIEIVSSPHERTEKLEFDYVPETSEEFNGIVNKAPWDILKGLGFRKWDTMNNLIKEHIENSTGSSECVSDHQDCPSELLKKDKMVILFPGEWYNIIPEGFEVTGLYGETYKFEKESSDDDIRFGCLPYGIKMDIE